MLVLVGAPAANWNVPRTVGRPLISIKCIGIAAGVALFSFIGVECASIAAGRVRNPRKNVLRASVIGTAAAGLLYVAVTAAVMGLVPHEFKALLARRPS